MEANARVMAAAQTETYEERLTTADGKKRYFLTTSGPVFDEQGQVIGLFGIARDVTRYKQLEQSQSQRIKELRTVSRVSTALRTAKTQEEMLPILLKEAMQVSEAECGAIYVRGEQHTSHHLTDSAWSKSCGELSPAAIEDIVSKVISSGQAYISNEREPGDQRSSNMQSALQPQADTDQARMAAGWSVACLPISTPQAGNETLTHSLAPGEERFDFTTSPLSPQVTVGVLLVAHPLPHDFSSEDIKVLSIIAEIAGVAILRTALRLDLETINQQLQAEVEQRRLMQRLLADEKELLQVTLMNISDGVISTDQDGTISLFNPVAGIITGYSADEAVGSPLQQVFPILDLTAGQAKEDYAATLQVYKAMHSDFTFTPPPTLLTRDGSKVLISFDITPIRAAHATDHTVQGYVIVFENITERQQAETQSALSQKMEAIGQLAAGIAHEINTPIQYVGDNLTFLQRGFERLLEFDAACAELVHARRSQVVTEQDELSLENLRSQKKMPHYLREIPVAIQEALDGVERVHKIVTAIREFSHPSGKEKKMADINHGILTTVTISRNAWKYVAELETELYENLPPVCCQIDEINQVILIMIVNAAQAIEETVPRGSEQKGKIVIRSAQRGEQVMIQIQDSGCGIPPMITNRIFDPFFTTKGFGKGTGQGLALAHQIVVKKHGGVIKVESQVGRGTTFTIELPIQPPEGEKRNEPS